MLVRRGAPWDAPNFPRIFFPVGVCALVYPWVVGAAGAWFSFRVFFFMFYFWIGPSALGHFAYGTDQYMS